jgi:DNA-binding phage protein
VEPALSRPDSGFANARVSNLRAAEMAEYLDARLNMANYDETTFARSLLLVSELHGMSHIARECGYSSEVMRRQLSGNRPLYLDSVLGAMRALGIRLRIEVI